MKQSSLDPQIVGTVIWRFRKRKRISQEVLSGLADLGRAQAHA